MTKNKALDSIPKMHTLRREIAEAVCHLVYSGNDKEFRKVKTREIDVWLADGNFFGNESPAELAEEWLQFDRKEDD
jgi:hypothetical protein